MSAATGEAAPAATETDRRFMAAAIRFAMRNAGRTATNPSVATLIVRDDGIGPVIVGRGVTAIGGRPHAETVALAEAGELARGATAYVTLEPCAHHGRTPPCAEALVTAGIARAVSAAADPDPRVDGKGHAILRAAGLQVTPRVMAEEAAETMSGYLNRHRRNRPEVTLKLAVSRDGKIGIKGGGQVKITGPVADAQTHLVRARHDAILVGSGTLLEDDPRLDCRLPGLGDRSPTRIVLDPRLRTEPGMALARTAGDTPTLIATFADADPARRAALAACGVAFLSCEADPDTGRIALPEMLEDLGAVGMSSILVEGGAETGASFLESDLVDRLILVEGDTEVGPDGVAAPIVPSAAGDRFRPVRSYRFGPDRWFEYVRRDA
ncbi:bifunctional diaminohydroxyphosphoribosylaminopyrimidine deaminase/5-amino-6-(5-phosphoribosylamino)uracil reductase RibD [Aurantimonas sp. HBX-1]|uniref:bifunctional diaminohydroxyphosphoribosylaminopyrimidine deaminase/5-amino-6-(5-phosphoribosylamino)uracil reductase RibD n=1 Tax=Aurantimonas sp. HBX-1 TaxID=2906072 RepID=UPI001F010924|nr:bifunctional diaminohydroxyphosphoribosylaminopyrimidine deaminase/5-amino-6-(5-phosphoribosylamino)uracil reductase RibD [Aurantimonas sp. HBX-1]UIJ70251.1 bifunctional diaminohydroxyphosphoribosylaminopyrimidine deaminase/5-amino-6-(5-phosphoribosylamino)uracil reductase RibD [Aurantimonas sp. HBX-1]